MKQKQKKKTHTIFSLYNLFTLTPLIFALSSWNRKSERLVIWFDWSEKWRWEKVYFCTFFSFNQWHSLVLKPIVPVSNIQILLICDTIRIVISAMGNWNFLVKSIVGLGNISLTNKNKMKNISGGTRWVVYIFPWHGDTSEQSLNVMYIQHILNLSYNYVHRILLYTHGLTYLVHVQYIIHQK